jgi:hypothetical protein
MLGNSYFVLRLETRQIHIPLQKPMQKKMKSRKTVQRIAVGCMNATAIETQATTPMQVIDRFSVFLTFKSIWSLHSSRSGKELITRPRNKNK